MTPHDAAGRDLGRRFADLIRWIEDRDYTGYDLYDGLTAVRSEAARNRRLLNTAVTQLFKHSPFNLRPLLGMPRTKMPKGVGLVLDAYARLAEQARRDGDEAAAEGYLRRADPLADWLLENACAGYAGPAWNFGFPYKQLHDKPTVVITAAVARGLFAYHRLTGREDVGAAVLKSCDFVLEDLQRTETADGLAFSYTPKDNVSRPRLLDCCYNASLLGAEILAMGHALSGEARLQDPLRRAADFVVAHQHEDGRWNYSVDPETGYERPQVDFHQGFVLDSLQACIAYGGLEGEAYRTALERGARFYREAQFTDAGRALWRLPKRWPADVHCQAQGVITFSKLRHLDPAYGPFAERVARWTVRHMQAPEGYFYHRRGRVFANRIAYMRWGQAWMMLALVHLGVRPHRPDGAAEAARGAAVSQAPAAV